VTARAAVAGVGYTALTARADVSVLELAREACAAAIADAGLQASDVDGIASFMVMHDSVPTQAVATTLGLPQMRFSLDVDLGGQAPAHLVAQAAAAVVTGQADAVLVYRAMKGRSGPRVGSMEFAGGAGQYRYPIGYSAYMMYCGMWGQRFLHETGQTELDLAAVALAQREYAQLNERAFRRKPLTLEQYLAAPYVVDPYRAADCTVEVDGACWRDYSRNYTSWLAADLYRQAGLTAADVQFAEIYDCFTSTVLMGLEGLGLCERGGSGAFIRDGGTGLAGRLPTNTHGGLLAEGYLHGMNTVTEAVLQIQGRGGDRQVPRHEVGIVTSGALMDGSGLILVADR
jgi:acetyl-CoA acetyltransferase